MSLKKSRHVCTVPNCFNKAYNSNTKFYRFPKDPTRARIWAMKTNREDLLQKVTDLSISYRVCENHFEEKMFTNHLHTRLLATAVPTIFPSLESNSRTAKADHPDSAALLFPAKIRVLNDRTLRPAIAESVSADQTVIVDNELKAVVSVKSNPPNVTSNPLMSPTSTQTSTSLTSNTPRKIEHGRTIESSTAENTYLRQRVQRAKGHPEYMALINHEQVGISMDSRETQIQGPIFVMESMHHVETTEETPKSDSIQDRIKTEPEDVSNSELPIRDPLLMMNGNRTETSSDFLRRSSRINSFNEKDSSELPSRPKNPRKKFKLKKGKSGILQSFLKVSKNFEDISRTNAEALQLLAESSKIQGEAAKRMVMVEEEKHAIIERVIRNEERIIVVLEKMSVAIEMLADTMDDLNK